MLLQACVGAGSAVALGRDPTAGASRAGCQCVGGVPAQGPTPSGFLSERTSRAIFNLLSGGSDFLPRQLSLRWARGRVAHFGTVDGDGFISAVASAINGSSGVGDICEAHLSNFRLGSAIDPVATDAFVDDRVVVANDVVVDDSRVVVDLLDSIVIDAILVPVVLAPTEVAAIHE